MAYGNRRGFKGRRSTGWGSRSRFGRTRRTTTRRNYRTYKGLKFATVGFAKNVEKKYWDKTYRGDNVKATVGLSGSGNEASEGKMWISTTWNQYNFTNNTPVTTLQSNDMNKGLTTGTTARTRIGNKVKPLYYKGAFTFTAAIVGAGGGEADDVGQGGEVVVGTGSGVALGARQEYVRTTYRMVIVKDLQVNSVDQHVPWSYVFETDQNLTAGVHSELSINNMGRFIVLEDKTFTLTADNPQKTCSFHISGSKIGPVRYNGAGAEALTDKGLYMVYAAYTMGIEGSVSILRWGLPDVVGHSRMCFTDD